MRIRSELGSVWFFSRQDFAAWPPTAAALPPTDLGRSNRVVDLTRPLTYFKGGMIRYYSSVEYEREDNVTIMVLDNRSFRDPTMPALGSEEPTSGGMERDGMCCCVDESCSQVRLAAV